MVTHPACAVVLAWGGKVAILLVPEVVQEWEVVGILRDLVEVLAGLKCVRVVVQAVAHRVVRAAEGQVPAGQALVSHVGAVVRDLEVGVGRLDVSCAPIRSEQTAASDNSQRPLYSKMVR